MNERVLPGVRLASELCWDGLRLVPAQGGARVCPGAEMEEKAFQRKASVLKGYVALLAARRGEGPLALEEGALPEGEGPDALLAVWYSRAREAAGQRERLMAYYNAFGALPGGFARVREHTAAFLGRELAEKLLGYVRDVREEEGDLAEKSRPGRLPSPWPQEELEAVDRAVLRAAAEGFSR